VAKRAEEIDRLARERLGLARLRPGQREAIESVLSGRDTLLVMASGAGKSAVYQLAGLMLDGPTIVVSPLIALQRDQVEALEGAEAAEAGLLNSTLTPREREAALEEVEEGELRFLLMAPEQLTKDDVRGELRAAGPALFVVDEAHCVSEWGHDFRPDYLRLSEAIEGVGRPPVLALTATAAPPVREDIVSLLGLRDVNVVVRGFDRPNLHLSVERHHDAEAKRRALLDAVAEVEPPGIVYTATKRATEELTELLRERGVSAHAYHGGLSTGRRDAVQTAFMEDHACDVIVATVAFGMGVDKPNVRWVFHDQVSESVDAYYQEIGRAGRDGKPAEARLFYRPEDLGLRRFFAAAGAGPEAVEEVADELATARAPVDPARLRERLSLSRSKVASALQCLERTGAVELDP
jgi:ATP-dependent DNA helicase RecQ